MVWSVGHLMGWTGWILKRAWRRVCLTPMGRLWKILQVLFVKRGCHQVMLWAQRRDVRFNVETISLHLLLDPSNFQGSRRFLTAPIIMHREVVNQTEVINGWEGAWKTKFGGKPVGFSQFVLAISWTHAALVTFVSFQIESITSPIFFFACALPRLEILHIW